MRITIIYRYYWPDTPPYASMLAQMTRWFVDNGYDVEVLTAQPAYKPNANIARQPRSEIRHGVKIRRIPLLPEYGSGFVKILNGGIFIALSTMRVIFGSKRDLIWTATMPPVLQAACLSFAARRRGAKFLYHMQDIHPEISTASNIMKTGFFSKLMRNIDVYTLNHTSAAIVLSRDMKNVLKERNANPEICRVIHNFSLGDANYRQPRKSNGKRTRFIFAGNIGRFQNLEALVDAFRLVEADRYILEIVGDGRIKKKLIEKVKTQDISNVIFHNHMSEDEVFQFMCECDVGVVSLAPGLYRYALPSKILTYMAANLPMLAIVENHSSLAKMIDKEKVGVTIDWSAKPERLAEKIRNAAAIAKDPDISPRKATHLYHKDVARKNWIDLLQDLFPAKIPGSDRGQKHE